MPRSMFTCDSGMPWSIRPSVHSWSSAVTRRMVRPVKALRMPATASRSRGFGAVWFDACDAAMAGTVIVTDTGILDGNHVPAIWPRSAATAVFSGGANA